MHTCMLFVPRTISVSLVKHGVHEGSLGKHGQGGTLSVELRQGRAARVKCASV